MKLLIGLFALLLPSTLAAQTPARATVIAAATDIIQKAHYCTFVTIGEDGQPQARMVDPIVPGADFTIWFATNPLTRKVDQVRRNPKVTLSCFDSGSSSYVTLLGRGDVVTDPTEKQRHWKNDWAAIYPNGAKGSDFMLIRITPARLEIVSESRGMVGDPTTWLPLAIDFPATASTQQPADVAAAARAFIVAFDNLDMPAFLDCFADGATLFHPPAASPRTFPKRFQGKQEIQRTFQVVFDQIRTASRRSAGPYMNLQPQDLLIQQFGDSAVLTFHLGSDTVTGRRTLIYRRTGPDWKIVHLHASSFEVAQ